MLGLINKAESQMPAGASGGYKGSSNFTELMGMLKSHIAGDRMWPRQLANTLWALAKMGLDDDEFIEPLFEQMERVRHAITSMSRCWVGSHQVACLMLMLL